MHAGNCGAVIGLRIAGALQEYQQSRLLQFLLVRFFTLILAYS